MAEWAKIVSLACWRSKWKQPVSRNRKWSAQSNRRAGSGEKQAFTFLKPKDSWYSIHITCSAVNICYKLCWSMHTYLFTKQGLRATWDCWISLWSDKGKQVASPRLASSPKAWTLCCRVRLTVRSWNTVLCSCSSCERARDTQAETL